MDNEKLQSNYQKLIDDAKKTALQESKKALQYDFLVFIAGLATATIFLKMDKLISLLQG